MSERTTHRQSLILKRLAIAALFLFCGAFLFVLASADFAAEAPRDISSLVFGSVGVKFTTLVVWLLVGLETVLQAIDKRRKPGVPN